MPAHWTYILLGILLTGWPLSVTAPQGLEPLALQSGGDKREGRAEATRHSQDVRPSFSIIISASQEVIKLGSPVSVQVTKTNQSDHEINNSRLRSFSGPYEIEVRDDQGNVRPETQASRRAKQSANSNPRATRSANFSSLKPGESERDRIDVARNIDRNQPGKYIIQLRQFDGDIKTVVKSNTITVTLIP